MVEFLDMHFLATISEQDFHEFQLCITELRQWPTYDDFVMDREGYFIGMSWAGLNVVQVEVTLSLFVRWVHLTGSHRGLQDLDDFAMRRWLRARHPEWNPSLVRSKATSLVAARSGQLLIPFCPTTAAACQDEVPPPQSDRTSNNVLAGVIAKECLDPAG